MSTEPSTDATDAVVALSRLSGEEIVERCQKIFANAWMVRTFVKHCEEVEDYPELMVVSRSIFDTARALETRVDDPEKYMKMLRKKIGKMRKAADEFRKDAPLASTHTNFQQAIISVDFCIEQLTEILTANEIANG